MVKQMCWLSPAGSDGEKVLHLRLSTSDRWKPYTDFKEFASPDYRDFLSGPDDSKGWATFQKLLKSGWTLIVSEPAYKSNFITQKPA